MIYAFLLLPASKYVEERKEVTSMIKNVYSRNALLLMGTLALALGLSASRAVAAGPNSVTMTVTAIGKKDTAPPEVKKDDIQLYQGKERLQVADWRRSETLYLAVLIDDSLDASISNQWNDLRAFIAAQPPTTYVAVAYGRNGTAMLAQD